MSTGLQKCWLLTPVAGGFALALALALALPGCGPKTITVGPGDAFERLGAASRLATEAQAAEEAGDTDKAIRLYREACQTYPDFHPAWNNLGVLLNEKGQALQAVDAFKRAADGSPQDPRPLANIGLIYKASGWEKAAADFFAQALERDDSYVPALRESIWIDVHRDTITEVTQQRVNRVLLLETDERWLNELRRYKLQIDERLLSQPVVIRPGAPSRGPAEAPPMAPDGGSESSPPPSGPSGG